MTTRCSSAAYRGGVLNPKLYNRRQRSPGGDPLPQPSQPDRVLPPSPRLRGEGRVRGHLPGTGIVALRGKDQNRAERVRSLRRVSTPAESALWTRIRGRQLGGFKFLRQEPIDRYAPTLLSLASAVTFTQFQPLREQLRVTSVALGKPSPLMGEGWEGVTSAAVTNAGKLGNQRH
jgi:hypothetical protein